MHAEQLQFAYSPQEVDKWLRCWELLCSLAETPHSSVHHLTPEHRHESRPCGDSEPVGIRSGKTQKRDTLRYAAIKADLEHALSSLDRLSLGWRVVGARMGHGGSLGDIAVLLRARKHDVCEAYKAAVATMARSLGWEDDA